MSTDMFAFGDTMKTIIGGILILGGLLAALPMLIMWDSIKIQMALGNYTLFNQWTPLGVGGLVALAIGYFLVK